MSSGSPEAPYFFVQWDPHPGNQDWRVELLRSTFSDTHQPGALVTYPYEAEQVYYGMNKPLAAREWLRSSRLRADDVVVLLDPDMVFVAPWRPVAPLAAQSHPFLGDPEHYEARGVPPTLGFPWVFDVATLDAVIDRWVTLGYEMWHEAQNWTAEMRSLAYVMADHDVVEREDLQMMNDGFGDPSAPLIHYNYHSPMVGGMWTKHEYRPGNPLPVAVEGTPEPARRFYEVLARYHHPHEPI